MGLLSHKVKKEDIKPGDHIYTYRALYTYSHHGIYVGGNKVIHFTSNNNSNQSTSSSSSFGRISGISHSSNSSSGSISGISHSSSSSSGSISGISHSSSSSFGRTSGNSYPTSSSSGSISGIPHSSSSSFGRTSGISYPTSSSFGSISGIPYTCPNFPDCGFRKPDSGVILSCLDCFLAGGTLRLYKYGVLLSTFLLTVRGGCCTMAQSDPAEIVVNRAARLLQIGFGDYNVETNNCEDFALYCKTSLYNKRGDGSSGQITSLLAASASVRASASASNTMGLAAVAVAMHSVVRCINDVSLSTDVDKVPVEDLPAYLSRNFRR